MKSNIWNSLRTKLVLYSVASLVLTLVTELGIGFLFYEISTILGASQTGYGFRRQMIQRQQNLDETLSQGGFLAVFRRFFQMDANTVYTILAVVLVTGIVLFILYFLLLTRRITRDLSYISSQITRMAKENVLEPIEIVRQDEIGEIAYRINEMIQEIFRLMEAEREALQTNKDLITCVAHDLRTPLTSVIGYLQLAMDVEKYPVEERQKYARIALDKANRLEGMIQDLFSYTKLMSGEISLHCCEIDVVKLMEQMMEEFYPIFQEYGLSCNFHKNTESLMMDLDPELIARAIQNLLSNATKYGKDGKQILMGLEVMEREVQITVTNYGLMISPDNQRLIFEKFYRVEESRSRETGGTGLGLNIAKEIVVLHGGEIQVESGEQGTIFTITLPQERVQKETDGSDLAAGLER